MRFSLPRILTVLLLVPIVFGATALTTSQPAPVRGAIVTEVRSRAMSSPVGDIPDILGAASDSLQSLANHIRWEEARVAAEEAQRAVQEAENARQRLSSRTVVIETNWPSSLYPCGGDLPPCYVKMRESGGDYNARNPTSTASGAWQFLDSTWAGFGGYPRAYLAPPEVQDERARQLWDGGRGCSHWSAC